MRPLVPCMHATAGGHRLSDSSIFVGPALLRSSYGADRGASSFQRLSGARGDCRSLGAPRVVCFLLRPPACAGPAPEQPLIFSSRAVANSRFNWILGEVELGFSAPHFTPPHPPSAPRRIPQGLSVCSRECTHVDCLEVALYMPGPWLQYFWPTRLASHFPLLPLSFLFGGVQAPTQSLKHAKSMPATTVNLCLAL